MAAKLLHSLADENPDLQKQIGCMTGIFQMFDRQPIFTGGSESVVDHAPQKPLHIGNSDSRSLERVSDHTHLRSASREKYSHKYIQEKQRISTESSRPSSSSSRSSSFSSFDCNRAAHLEPASYDRILFPETPLPDPATSTQSSSPQFSRQSLDIRDLVKDSMHRKVHALSSTKAKSKGELSDPAVKNYRDLRRSKQSKASADLNESLKALPKLQEAPWYQNEPRELLRSASYHMKEGSSFSVSRDIAPRLSYDGRETRDVSKSTLVKHKDIPRLSLDRRESSMWGTKSMQKDSLVEFGGQVGISKQTPVNQTRPPSVVAKLMGLETLPDSVPLSSDGNSVSGRSYPYKDFVNMSANTDGKSSQASGSSRNMLWKDTSSPRWRNVEPHMNPILRFPIEPAPWKHIDSTKGSQKPAGRAMRAPAKSSKSFPSVYSEIEKWLKDLKFTQSGKDLRALKQILEAMQSMGFMETEKEVQGSNEQKHSNSNNHESRSVSHNQKAQTGSSRHYESPIVIMKPANMLVEKSGLPAESVTNSINRKKDRTTKTTQTPSRLAKDGSGGSGKNSGSISPRMQQKKLELEKVSRPPTPSNPSKSRIQPNKQQSEYNSPGGRPRPKQTGEVSAESRYLYHREKEISVQSNESILRGSKSDFTGGSERSTDLSSCQSLSVKASKFMLSDSVDKNSIMGMSEVESAELGFVPPEYSSPVSVLDKVVCKDDSPSPVKYVGKTLRADISSDQERNSGVIQGSPVYSFVPNSTESGSASERSRKKLQNIDNLVQKLRRLNSTHDEARTDYIASLCENANPDHRYVSEILLASGLLLRELGSSLENFQFHPSGHPINPELFLVLEQTKASSFLEEEYSAERTTQLLIEGKFHRKLIFDTVNEILGRKLASADPGKQLSKRAVNAQKLLRDLCLEIELLQAKNPKFGLNDDGWKDILCEDVLHQSESWKTFDDAISGAVLDIERSIFKDLVNDIVVGESYAGVKTSRPGRRRLFVK